jgi:hypothetical protein
MNSRSVAVLSAIGLVLLGTGCSDAGPTEPQPQLPFPSTTSPQRVAAYISLVSDDVRLRLLPSLEDRPLASGVTREMEILDAGLVARDRAQAETALMSARDKLDRALEGDFGDTQAIHLALDAAAALLGLPISAFRYPEETFR